MAATDKTYAQLITEVRALINEPSAYLFSDTDIQAWIDYGTQEIYRKGLAKQTSKLVTLTTSVRAYTVSGLSNYLKIEAVIYAGGTSLDTTGNVSRALAKVHPRHLGNNVSDSTDGIPTEWWVHNNQLFINPSPSSEFITHKLEVLYYDYPYGAAGTVYHTGSVYQLDYHLQEYTILYAVSKALQRRGNIAAAEMYMGLFNSFIMYHRMNTVPLPVDSKSMMHQEDRTQLVQ